MDTIDKRFAITEYPDAREIDRKLDYLIAQPIYTIKPDVLKAYEENYFEKKCAKSKVMTTEAKTVIPGGVQHNLAFNYPFPIVITKAEGAKLYDIDGNWYYDLLQAGGPTILGSNDPVIRDAVIDLLNTCGPSTGLFHEYEYKLAKKISDLVPSVDKFRMLGSGTEACMCALRVARLKTGKKNVLKMGGAYHGWSDQMAYGMRIPGTKGLQSPGVPNFVFKHTDEFFPNDLEDLERKLKRNQLTGGTAAVYIEPVGPESGTRPVSKEFVREWLMANGFQGQEGQKVPEMTPEIVNSITDRYIELYEHIVGEPFTKEDYSPAEIEAKITACLATLK